MGVREDRVEGELVEDRAATDQQHVPSHLRLQERRKKMVDSFSFIQVYLIVLFLS